MRGFFIHLNFIQLPSCFMTSEHFHFHMIHNSKTLNWLKIRGQGVYSGNRWSAFLLSWTQVSLLTHSDRLASHPKMFGTMQFRPQCNINEWIMFLSTEFQYLMSACWTCHRKLWLKITVADKGFENRQEISGKKKPNNFNLKCEMDIPPAQFLVTDYSPGCKVRWII